MADYIDREEFKNEYRNGEVRSAIEVIDSMPSVDAVKVVRCKDCKRNVEGFCAEFERIMPSGQQGGVRHEWHKVNDNDFCKWGEKE